MARLTRFTLAGVLLGLASAQSQTQAQSALVTQIFFPLADPQPLDASIVAQSPGVTTIVMNCAPDTPSESCGFPTPITLTVGPSTLHYIPSGIYEIFGDLDCKITASATADCVATAGLYSDAADASGTDTGDAYITTPALSSTTTSGVLSGSDVSWLDITITAGLEKVAGTVTGTSATATATATSKSVSGGVSSGTSSGGGTGTRSGSGSGTETSASRTGTSSAGAASATGNIAAGSSKVAYTGLGVAAVFVAGSMMLL